METDDIASIRIDYSISYGYDQSVIETVEVTDRADIEALLKNAIDDMYTDAVSYTHLDVYKRQSLACSAETAAKIDEEVVQTVKTAHEKAIGILQENMEALHRCV